MYPHKMVEDRFGTMQRVPWSKDKANAKLRMIASDAEAELNKRDCDTALELADKMNDPLLRRMAEGGVLQTCAVTEHDKKGNGTYRTHQLASQIKHSGAESGDMTRERWLKFCSEPQEDDIVIPMPKFKRKEKRTFMPPAVVSRSMATEPPQAVAVMEEDKPQSRKDEFLGKPKPRGRTFGSKNKATDEPVTHGQLPEHSGTADAVS